MPKNNEFSENKNDDVENDIKWNFQKRKQRDDSEPEQKKVKRLRLSNPQDVRRYIANLMKRVENDEIEQGKARLLNNLAESILKSIRTDEVEKKILELEEMIQDKNHHVDDDNDFYLKQIK